MKKCCNICKNRAFNCYKLWNSYLNEWNFEKDYCSKFSKIKEEEIEIRCYTCRFKNNKICKCGECYNYQFWQPKEENEIEILNPNDYVGKNPCEEDLIDKINELIEKIKQSK